VTAKPGMPGAEAGPTSFFVTTGFSSNYQSDVTPGFTVPLHWDSYWSDILFVTYATSRISRSDILFIILGRFEEDRRIT